MRSDASAGLWRLKLEGTDRETQHHCREAFVCHRHRGGCIVDLVCELGRAMGILLTSPSRVRTETAAEGLIEPAVEGNSNYAPV